MFVGTQNWAHNCKWVGQPALIRWLVIALNCFYNFHLSDQEMKRHGLTLRASCKEPNYGISLLTVSLPGRRLCSYVVAWEAGAAQLKSSLGILSPFQSDSGKWRRQIKPCRIKKGQGSNRTLRPQSDNSINLGKHDCHFGRQNFPPGSKENSILKAFLFDLLCIVLNYFLT